jgi:hypothetical protein
VEHSIQIAYDDTAGCRLRWAKAHRLPPEQIPMTFDLQGFHREKSSGLEESPVRTAKPYHRFRFSPAYWDHTQASLAPSAALCPGAKLNQFALHHLSPNQPDSWRTCTLCG